MKIKLGRYLSTLPALLAVAVFSLPGIVLAQKVAQESGDWPGIEWSPAGDPSTGDQVNIGNDFVVNYIGDPDEGRVGRIYVGSDAGGFTPNGTLTISAGSLETASNGSLAIQIGHSDNSVAILNISGGTLIADNGGWLNVGNGLNSSGTVNLSSGMIQTDTNNVTLGSADGSTGTMNMTGGVLDVAGIMFVGRTNTNDNHGVFNQSGGTATIGGLVRIGNATAAGHQPSGAVTLTGGSTTFEDNLIIGNTNNGVLGAGTLSVGSNANLQSNGTSSMIELGGNSELRFLLGSDDNFNAIDLTSTTSGSALSFLEDSLISFDGSNMAFGAYDPINLILFASGQGPSAASLSNVDYSYDGFASGMSAQLEWTDTALVLTVIPEPATVALFMGAVVLVCVGLIRRRRISGSC